MKRDNNLEFFRGGYRVYTDIEVDAMSTKVLNNRTKFYKEKTVERRAYLKELEEKISHLSDFNPQQKLNIRKAYNQCIIAIEHYTCQCNRFERFIKEREKNGTNKTRPDVVTKQQRDFELWERYRSMMDDIMLRAMQNPNYAIATEKPDDTFIIRYSPFQANKASYDNANLAADLKSRLSEITRDMRDASTDKRALLSKEMQSARIMYADTFRENETIIQRVPARRLDPNIMLEEMYKMHRHMAFSYYKSFNNIREIRYLDGNMYILVNKIDISSDPTLDKQKNSACMSCFINPEYATVVNNDKYFPAGYVLHDKTDGQGMHYNFIDDDIKETDTFRNIFARVCAEIKKITKRKSSYEWWYPIDINNLEKYY